MDSSGERCSLIHPVMRVNAFAASLARTPDVVYTMSARSDPLELRFAASGA
jgi:hypothetical protein